MRFVFKIFIPGANKNSAPVYNGRKGVPVPLQHVFFFCGHQNVFLRPFTSGEILPDAARGIVEMQVVCPATPSIHCQFKIGLIVCG